MEITTTQYQVAIIPPAATVEARTKPTLLHAMLGIVTLILSSLIHYDTHSL